MILIDYEVRNYHSCGWSRDKKNSYQKSVTLDELKYILGGMALWDTFSREDDDNYSCGEGPTRYTDYPTYHLEILDWDYKNDGAHPC